MIGEFIVDKRHFFNTGVYDQQKSHSSFTFSPEVFLENSEGIFHFKGKLRKDNEDSERNLIDIQELYIINILDEREK